MNALFQRSFLRLLDFTSAEITQLLLLAADLKSQKSRRKETKYLIDKNIALIFEKDSTRTRCSFEIAAFDQGAHVTYLGPSGNQINFKESIQDTARVLGRLYDGIQYRGYKQETIEILAQYAGVPVWNGLTDTFHPTQLLADMLTMKECLPTKHFNKMKLAYIGDIKNNIGNTLLEAAALIGFDLRLIAPSNFWPNQTLVEQCRDLAQQNGGSITITENISVGVKDVDFIYSDVWVSMGEDKKLWAERIFNLRPYHIDMTVMRQTCNAQVKFLHCLPAFHDDQTILGKQIAKKFNLSNGIEVSNDVFDSQHSLVFDQAENRMHTIKALIIATMTESY